MADLVDSANDRERSDAPRLGGHALTDAIKGTVRDGIGLVP